ncbi:MAG: hypothetical protein N2A42_03380 [Luteolibacter sp.]|jgi:hypothetical protein|tara:strand:+ start:1219 stop:1401 length:183 start_codon:yes stop_codon:yes gene_type:complete
MFAEVKPLTLFGSLKSITFRLWDESNKKLISFRKLRQLRHEQVRKNEGNSSQEKDRRKDE